MTTLQHISLLGGIASASAANTAAATSGWIDIRGVIGDIRVIVDVGAVGAGSITPAIQDADDGSGTNPAAVTPLDGAFTAVDTNNDPLRQVRHIDGDAVRGWIRFVGTVVTGPAQLAVAIEGRNKYSA